MEKNQEHDFVYTDVDFYYQEKDKLVKSIFQNEDIINKVLKQNFKKHLKTQIKNGIKLLIMNLELLNYN